MKTLKQFLIVSAFVILASVTAFAQKQDDQKTPPKEKPPKVVVPKEDKKPKENNDNRPKKPQGEISGVIEAFRD